MYWVSELVSNFIQLFVESATWLILGFLVAGIIKAFIPVALLSKHLGQSGPWAVTKAALLGAPLPLCSCGVIPASMGLRRNGASKSATTSFLISTPETGVDSIAISYALLGPFMAVIRPIAAVSSAITAGLLVGKEESVLPPASEKSTSTSCCASKKAAQPEQLSLLDRMRSGIRFTFIDLVYDITLWLLIGLGFATLILTFIPGDFLAQWGDGFLAFVVMALIGVPMYICATSSTPIAAGLLFSGVSPGAVLVFMLVGPATNIATVALVKRELGTRALAAYLGSVVGVGFIFAWLTNYLADQWQLDFTVQTQHAHAMAHTPLAYAASVLLAGLMGYALLRKVKIL